MGRSLYSGESLQMGVLLFLMMWTCSKDHVANHLHNSPKVKKKKEKITYCLSIFFLVSCSIFFISTYHITILLYVYETIV